MKCVGQDFISEFIALNSRIRQSVDECSSDDDNSVDDRTINNIIKRDSITINVDSGQWSKNPKN